MLTYREISEILKMVDASECEEFVLELEDIKLVIRRGAAGASASPLTTSSASNSTTPVPLASQTVPTPAPTPASGPGPAQSAAQNETIELRSPMVGTFYRRASPDKPYFVQQGDQVEPGTALCLIEVMKLYTTIESTVSGTIAGILAEDGQLVEYDQLLFIFSPTAS